MWNSTTRSCHDSTNNAHDGQYCFLSKLLNCWRRSTISYTSHVFWKRLHKHGTETKECIQCTRSPSFITKTFCDVFCFEFWSITQNITDGGIFSAVITLKPIIDRMLSQSGRQDEPACWVHAIEPTNTSSFCRYHWCHDLVFLAFIAR